jgi:cytochrome P450
MPPPTAIRPGSRPPDRLDVRRDSSHHLGFGCGPHHCLGAPLAKAEAEIAISALLRRCTNLALATDTILWGRGRFIRGLPELPVTFDPVPPGGRGHQREDR